MYLQSFRLPGGWTVRNRHRIVTRSSIARNTDALPCTPMKRTTNARLVTSHARGRPLCFELGSLVRAGLFRTSSFGEALAKARGLGTYPPHTPALSPLRGEGARWSSWSIGERPAALVSQARSGHCAHMRRRVFDGRGAPVAFPSPLHGERAEVRGGTSQPSPRFARAFSLPLPSGPALR
jgi:hypothetical protein